MCLQNCIYMLHKYIHISTYKKDITSTTDFILLLYMCMFIVVAEIIYFIIAIKRLYFIFWVGGWVKLIYRHTYLYKKYILIFTKTLILADRCTINDKFTPLAFELFLFYINLVFTLYFGGLYNYLAQKHVVQYENVWMAVYRKNVC